MVIALVDDSYSPVVTVYFVEHLSTICVHKF